MSATEPVGRPSPRDDLPVAPYRNPVIPGFHPDPSVCRVGEEYFLATSSFTYWPGVPIFRSANLVDWTQIGNALDRPSLLDLSETTRLSSLGVFAPTLRHHDGRFWLITTVFTLKGPDTSFVTAEDAAGPWSEPVRVGPRRHRPGPGLGPRRDLLGPLLDRCPHRAVLHRHRQRSGCRRSRAHLVRDRPPVPRGAPPVRAGRDVVPAHRRGRHGAGPRRVDRPGPVAHGPVGGLPRPTRSSATAAPTGRSRTPATPISSRRPTARGGWCSWARGPGAGRRAGTSSVVRRSSRP